MAQNRESYPSNYSKGSFNVKASKPADLANKIYLPQFYDKIRNKKEFQEFIQSVQTSLHEQSFANDEAAMERHS